MDNLKLFLVAPVFLLAACAPHTTVNQSMSPDKATPSTQAETAPKVVSVEKRKAETATISSWEIRGALAAKNKAKGWSASMNWVQNGPGSYHIRLMGPLGAGTVLISKNGGAITFQDGPKKITSSNADELFLQQTGIRLPVTNLYYWVRGLPAPGAVSSEHRDQSNHLAQLRQSGYTINFGQYTTVKGADLPSLIRLEGNGVMIKVIIKNWRV
jgi:outer membrane lipoprotein LolB